MTALKKKFADVHSRASFFFKEVWPYYRHPRWILRLEKDRNYYRSIVENYTEKTFKDEVVQQLQTELHARKMAYDGAEEQFEEEINDLLDEIDDLKQKLATVYAQNADLWAKIAQMMAGGDPNAVQTKAASADR